MQKAYFANRNSIECLKASPVHHACTDSSAMFD